MPKGHNITNKQRFIVYSKANGICEYCGDKVFGSWQPCTPYTKSGLRGEYHFAMPDCAIHHIYFYSLGGEDNFNNWALVCNKCHKHIHGAYLHNKTILLPMINQEITNA